MGMAASGWLRDKRAEGTCVPSCTALKCYRAPSFKAIKHHPSVAPPMLDEWIHVAVADLRFAGQTGLHCRCQRAGPPLHLHIDTHFMDLILRPTHCQRCTLDSEAAG